MPDKLTILTDDRGEWVQMDFDGDVFFEGHSIPTWVWLDLVIPQVANWLEVEKRDHSFLSEEEYDL